jgi:lipoprotein-anchoring transpeptidase ErfK/SrfK
MIKDFRARRHAFRETMRRGRGWVRGAVFVLFLALAWPSRAESPAGSASTTQWVEIDKTLQRLRAYEGDRLILESRISTGKWDRSTPNGRSSAGVKYRMHYSKLDHNAPMPYSVQVVGNVFIHGFTSVPNRPALHGCIRLPLDGDNPARRFFEWIEPGTPISIHGRWEGR